MNSKYEITNIPHEKYPFLHRIRALRDIGHDVKAGDLGGFVESENNLSFEDGDEAWIYDNAIACERSYVNKHSQLRDSAVIRNTAYISEGARLSGESKAEDDSYVRGGQLAEKARVCGNAMIKTLPDTLGIPVIRGNANVYGKVMGAIHIGGDALVFSSEELRNDTSDLIEMDEKGRTVHLSPERKNLCRTPNRKDH
ncbi:MAG: hypothetical protein IJQ98_03835, partial [Oscillospiraceae bacterium]|nr:hypothetical protein [Oscillospiraceae bacterium]